MQSKKLYVLDTNVLIHDPKAFLQFQGALVGIPLTVIEELDHFKKDNSQRGFSAREAVRFLDQMRSWGSLREGVQLEHGGSLKVLTSEDSKGCDNVLDGAHDPDSRILNMAFCAQKNGYQVELVTKDLNMRVKADAIGLKAVDYLRDIVAKDEFYRGVRTIRVPAVQLKQQVPSDLEELAATHELYIHEYVIVASQHNEYHYRVFRYDGKNKIISVEAPAVQWAIEPRNVEQLIALHLLFDDTIPIVSLLGRAGTGKTLLALVAALYKVLVEEVYTKVLVSRPIIPLGPDIGYLPGELQEKLYHWMQPVYDNMEFIAHMARGSSAAIFYEQNEKRHKSRDDRKEEIRDGKQESRNHHDRKKRDEREHRGPRPPEVFRVEQLIARGKLSLEAITYMRGRSIPYRYIIIDEVQNLTPHEVKTIVSRVGVGSKIVLAGDPYQIDSPYLDFSSNGLMVLTDRFKGQELFGTVFLEKSERSQISQLASELL